MEKSNNEAVDIELNDNMISTFALFLFSIWMSVYTSAYIIRGRSYAQIKKRSFILTTPSL